MHDDNDDDEDDEVECVNCVACTRCRPTIQRDEARAVVMRQLSYKYQLL